MSNQRGAGGNGCLIGCGVGALMMLLVPMLFFGFFNNGAIDKGGRTASNVDCANASDYVKNAEYLPWVRDAAEKYLKGDQAVLIALIQTESSWNPKGAAHGSSAAGLGQFTSATARGYKEFTGGDDRRGITWPAGKIYDNPDVHADDARFDPKRAIYAAAHKFGDHMKTYGDPEKAYIEGYHTHSNDAQLKEAQAGAKRMMEAYNKLKSGGSCSQSAQFAQLTPFDCDGKKYVYPIATSIEHPIPLEHHNYSASDIFVPNSTHPSSGHTVIAVTDGKIQSVDKTNSFTETSSRDKGGITVTILGNDGFTYYYAHLEAGSNRHLTKGQKIRAGEVIGKIGNTGNAVGTGPHLHFGISQPGKQTKGWFPAQVADSPNPQKSNIDALKAWKKNECVDPRR